VSKPVVSPSFETRTGRKFSSKNFFAAASSVFSGSASARGQTSRNAFSIRRTSATSLRFISTSQLLRKPAKTCDCLSAFQPSSSEKETNSYCASGKPSEPTFAAAMPTQEKTKVLHAAIRPA
jgi:hypothetical protein